MKRSAQITKEQIETPALLIDLDILERNILNMANFMKDKNTINADLILTHGYLLTMNKERQIKQAGDHWRLIKLNLKAQQCKTRKKAIKILSKIT